MTTTITVSNKAEALLANAVLAHVNKLGPFKSRKRLVLFAKAFLKTCGIDGTILDAQEDFGGNCIYCGEAGRCNGAHLANHITIDQ